MSEVIAFDADDMFQATEKQFLELLAHGGEPGVSPAAGARLARPRVS